MLAPILILILSNIQLAHTQYANGSDTHVYASFKFCIHTHGYSVHTHNLKIIQIYLGPQSHKIGDILFLFVQVKYCIPFYLKPTTIAFYCTEHHGPLMSEALRFLFNPIFESQKN